MKLARQEAKPPPTLAGDGNWIPQGTRNAPPEWKAIAGTDPGFVNAAAGDYRPKAGSPLIGAGCMPPDADIGAKEIPPQRKASEGAARPADSGKDIGAYPAAGAAK